MYNNICFFSRHYQSGPKSPKVYKRSIGYVIDCLLH